MPPSWREGVGTLMLKGGRLGRPLEFRIPLWVITTWKCVIGHQQPSNHHIVPTSSFSEAPMMVRMTTTIPIQRSAKIEE
jgi:hypothetical protein